ncbi:MAG: hypothetical protein MUP47_05450 [Phycisphaerae bacterium]|nr:hypothetical protein [Phycisphaerae bacterium]
MYKWTKVSLVLLAGLLIAQTLPTVSAVSEKRKAQNKLVTMRAARVDAMRKLAERINGLVIKSETTVKDFVATDDRIQTAMESWLVGARQVGEATYTPDGICSVTMEVTLEEVVVELKKLHKEYYKGDRVTIEDLDQILVTTQEKTLRETGSGAPRPEFDDRGLTVGAGASGQDIMSPRAWEYWTAHCTGQGRLMARQAALRVAQRNLSERINGLFITSETTVKDFVATDDRIHTEMMGFLQGTRQVGERYHDNELIVEVDVEITLQSLIVNLQKWHKDYYKGDRIRTEDFEKLTVAVGESDVRETGMGVPPEQYLKDVPQVGVAAVSFATQAANWPPTMTATGQSALDTEATNAAQAKLMAYRAAELDARRKLAEELDGLMITSSTSVRDFVAMNDQIRTSMLTFQQGGRVVSGSEVLKPDGTAEVVVELELRPLWNMVLFYQEKLAIQVK